MDVDRKHTLKWLFFKKKPPFTALKKDVLQLVNVEEIEARHLEITNHGVQHGVRRGVLISLEISARRITFWFPTSIFTT
jgi:hypothetical protein